MGGTIYSQWIGGAAGGHLSFWVALLERMQPAGERAGKRTVIGMIIGFSGLILLVAPDLMATSLSGYYLLGIFALQVGCASWSAGSVYAKHHPARRVAPLLASSLQMLVAGLALRSSARSPTNGRACNLTSEALALFFT
ncbi:MAG: hypothetical protein WKF30_14135 [Pyrinomonadaceae bacterium]